MFDIWRSYAMIKAGKVEFNPIMSQGYIGYDLQNSLREELLNRGMHKPVATILTQVEVNPEDPAFQHPTKPIGTFMLYFDCAKTTGM